MQQTTLKFTRGPALKFTGEMIAEDEWESRKSGRIIRIEFWATQGGALIGVRRSRFDDEPNWSEGESVVIEPTGDEHAMRLDLLHWFQFEQHATKLAKKLRWSLTKEVA